MFFKKKKHITEEYFGVNEVQHEIVIPEGNRHRYIKCIKTVNGPYKFGFYVGNYGYVYIKPKDLLEILNAMEIAKIAVDKKIDKIKKEQLEGWGNVS